MKTLVAVGLVLLLGVGVPFTTNACGGGGTNTPTPDPAALFSGAYFYNAFAGDFGTPTRWAWWGDLTADGVSMITGGTLGWNGGGAIGAGPLAPLAYTVDAARRLTLPAGGPFNTQGGISPDGSVATVASIGTGGFPSLAIMLKRAGSFGLASLNGVYHMVSLWGNGGQDIAWWGTVTFDGVGGAMDTFQGNSNGTLVGPFGPTAQTYTVAANGTVTCTLTPGNEPLQGGILMGGDLVVLSGSMMAGGAPSLWVLIRQSTAASVGTLTGGYHLVSHTADAGAPPPHFSSFTGTGSADGAGSLTVNVGGTINVDGIVQPFPAAPANIPYAVAANGALTLAFAGTPNVGAVSPTGAYAAVAGGTTPGSNPVLWFLLR